MGLQPVPIALVLYGGFVAWRLNRAYADALSPRLLSLSAFVDVGVLMLLIWSFTLQYDAPAALYLKSPTLLYAFILIALRALRFDAGHVLLTGGLAIVGWLALVLIAANEAPDHQRLSNLHDLALRAVGRGSGEDGGASRRDAGAGAWRFRAPACCSRARP